MENTKIVLIAGNFLFPKGNAAGKRVLGIGYILKNLGYEVAFAGCDRNRQEQDIKNTKKKYGDFYYYNFCGNRSARGIMNVKGAFKEFIDVAEDIGEDNISLVILYGSPVLACWISKVLHYGVKRNIPIVFDCVDWIEKSGFDSRIKNIIKFIDTNYMKRYLALKCDGVIAVSSYLYNYYKHKGCKVIEIPPVGIKRSAISENTRLENKNKKIYFIYAGALPLSSGFKRKELKDRIDLSVELVAELKKNGIDFVFDIYGIEKEIYKRVIPEHVKIIDKELSGNIVFHGVVSNNEVCKAFERADFMLLNRSVTKVTTAGFPSKISESLCMGVPVIVNDTSNLKDYIKNYKNGLIISFDQELAVKEISELCMSRETINKMKENCLKECIFDYHRYEDKMKLFLQKLR